MALLDQLDQLEMMELLAKMDFQEHLV